MIITKTPFRMSFFGGGTDLPQWYLKNGGAVLSTTINKFCYVTCRQLPPFFDHKHKIAYSKIESVNHINEILHPTVREALRFMKLSEDLGLEVGYNADLPTRCGLGTSSAFTVGLLNALYAIQGRRVDKHQLALDAIHIEQNLVKENVGSQDQMSAAHGGLNHITFNKDSSVIVNPLCLSKGRLDELQKSLMLFFSGSRRVSTASAVEGTKIKQMADKTNHFKALHETVDKAIKILHGDGEIAKFGELMDEAWKNKKALSEGVSNSLIDETYEKAKYNGAVGGKILGAGGGGLICLFVPPENQNKVHEALKNLVRVPFRFENQGSRIIHYENSGGFE